MNLFIGTLGVLNFSLLVILFLMIGKEQEAGSNLVDKESIEEEELQWKTVTTSLTEGYEMATLDEEKIYACSYQEEGVILSIFEKNQMELIETFAFPEMIEVKSLFVNESKEICLFSSTGNGDAFYRISSSGNIQVLENIEVEDLNQLAILNNMEVEDLNQFIVLNNIYGDSQGFYYLWYTIPILQSELYKGQSEIYVMMDRIYVKDQEMNTILYEEVPDIGNNKLLSFGFAETGIPMFFAREAEEYGSEIKYYMQQIRIEKGEEYATQYLENMDADAFYYLEEGEELGQITFMEDGVLYLKSGVLYQYDFTHEREKKVLDLAGIGILEEDILYLGMKKGMIEIIDYNKNLQQAEYMMIYEGESERKKLILGTAHLSSNMKEIITMFNRSQNEITIEPKIYVENHDYEGGYQKLTLDIIQGEGPDLIDVYGIEAENLANAGAFVDLYGLMEGDEELKADSLVDSVRKVYEVEGKLYSIAPTFRLFTMWGASSVVKGRSGVSMEEIIQILEENERDINSIYGFSADESPLTTLCTFNLDKFIDWTEGSCDFTSKEFGLILDFAKAYKGQSIGSLSQAIQEKDVLFTMGLINCVEDYRLESELYKENLEFIGYPTHNGNGVAAQLAGEKMAINGNTEYQEEAWEFIKFFMENGQDGTGFPLDKEKLEEVLAESLNKVMVTEDGVTAAVVKKRYQEYDYHVNLEVYQCELEDVEVVRELIENVSDQFKYNIEIQKIIDEEVGAYMENQKGLEEVCSIIQNRVQLYVDELG